MKVGRVGDELAEEAAPAQLPRRLGRWHWALSAAVDDGDLPRWVGDRREQPERLQRERVGTELSFAQR